MSAALSPRLPPFELRIATGYDTAQMISSWVSTQRLLYPNRFARRFPETCSAIARSILAANQSMVAHVEDEPSEMLGWLCYSYFRETFLVVHYVWVHADARRQGLCTRLMSACNPLGYAVLFRHAPASEAAMKHFSQRYIFDPFAGEVP